MNEKTRRNLLIALILAVVLGLALLLFLLFFRRPAATPTTEPAGQPAASEPAAALPSTTNPAVAAVNPPPAAPAKPGATPLAELFAERYGSWSTQERAYQNLIDLYPVMTAGYRAEIQELVAKSSTVPSATYSGVTSLKINSRLEDGSTDTAATVDVTLQQTKTGADGASTISYPVLKVELVKVGEDWKVDSASWAS